MLSFQVVNPFRKGLVATEAYTDFVFYCNSLFKFLFTPFQVIIMKHVFVLFIIMALVTVLVAGLSVLGQPAPQYDATGRFLAGGAAGSLGLLMVFILAAVFTLHSLLKRHIIEY